MMFEAMLHGLKGSTDFLAKGGIVMIPIIGGSLLGGALILERLWYYRRVRCNPDALTEDIYPLVKSQRWADASATCQQFRGPLPYLFQLVLQQPERPLDELEQMISIAGSRELGKLSHSLRLLGFIGQIEPLLGFLGTVFGMITTFMQIASLQGHVNPSLLAGGIWEALITTAAGLTVAIPIVSMTHYFEGVVEKIAFQMKNYTHELLLLVKA